MLRALEIEDLDFVYAIENDAETWQHSDNNEPYSRHLLTQYLANQTGDIYADKQLRLVITDGEDRAVGLADLTDFSPRHLRAAVGLVVGKEYRRKGIGSQALAHLIIYSREVLGLRQLYAIVSESNTASLALFAKHGFQATATLCDWLSTPRKQQNAVFMQLFL